MNTTPAQTTPTDDECWGVYIFDEGWNVREA